MKCDYIRYISSEISTINVPNSQICINLPREDNVVSLLNSYIELIFYVLHAATGNEYADGDDIRLFNLGPIALFSGYKLATSSREHLEHINNAHIVSSMYRVITSSKDSDDLSIGFDRCCDTRRQELTNNKNFEGKYHIRNYLRDFFGFAEHQETATYGLGYKLTLERNTENAVLNNHNAINNAKFEINALERYVPHYTPSLEEKNKLKVTKRTPTKLHYPENSVFMKEVNTQNL